MPRPRKFERGDVVERRGQRWVVLNHMITKHNKSLYECVLIQDSGTTGIIKWLPVKQLKKARQSRYVGMKDLELVLTWVEGGCGCTCCVHFQDWDVDE